jgi:hypothetical protein
MYKGALQIASFLVGRKMVLKAVLITLGRSKEHNVTGAFQYATSWNLKFR